MRMKRHFDPDYMVKRRPKPPRKYQKGFFLYQLGVISPSRRLIFYDPEYELNFLKWLCYRRVLDKHGWKKLMTLKKNQERRADCKKKIYIGFAE